MIIVLLLVPKKYEPIFQIPEGHHYIFISASTHAGENLNTIIDRNQREISGVGYCFWGYGGSLGSPHQSATLKTS